MEKKVEEYKLRASELHSRIEDIKRHHLANNNESKSNNNLTHAIEDAVDEILRPTTPIPDPPLSASAPPSPTPPPPPPPPPPPNIPGAPAPPPLPNSPRDQGMDILLQFSINGHFKKQTPLICGRFCFPTERNPCQTLKRYLKFGRL